MKKFAIALAFGMALSGAAYADTLANAHENTVVVTYANGAQARYHFNADNTFGVHTPDGGHVHGTYELANGQLCLTPAGGERGCSAYVGDKNVGDSWTQTATDGSTINVTLEAGRGGGHDHGH
ncbi:MAG: hypothetical protein J0L81_05870 [Caulobacterales bacterium]|jgi:hypothetical protein|nr:hypothetical protein [Caulobacterales bacterium]